MDEPLVLVASRARWIAVAAVSLVFVLIALALGTSRLGNVGIFAIAFFALGAVVGGLSALFRGSLSLTREGFTFAQFGRRQSFGWRDVQRFGVYRTRLTSFVGFDFAADYPRMRAARSLARGISGFEAQLPDTYGLPADRLAALMESWRSGTPQRL